MKFICLLLFISCSSAEHAHDDDFNDEDLESLLNDPRMQDDSDTIKKNSKGNVKKLKSLK